MVEDDLVRGIPRAAPGRTGIGRRASPHSTYVDLVVQTFQFGWKGFGIGLSAAARPHDCFDAGVIAGGRQRMSATGRKRAFGCGLSDGHEAFDPVILVQLVTFDVEPVPVVAEAWLLP